MRSANEAYQYDSLGGARRLATDNRDLNLLEQRGSPITTPTADTIPHTRRPALRWFLTWTLTYIMTQGIAVACNVTLIATDAFGRTTENHDQPGFDGAIGQAVSWWWGVVLLQVPQLVLALTVLWFVGRRLGSIKFRLLSLLMFLWYAPVWGLFWSGGFALETWALAQLAFALAISRPKPSGDHPTAD